MRFSGIGNKLWYTASGWVDARIETGRPVPGGKIVLRNIHFFNIRSGVDEKRILHLIDNDLVEYAKSFGCIERRTLKRLDSSVKGNPAPSPAYMNESLWPSRKEADAFSADWTRSQKSGTLKKGLAEIAAGMEIENSVRYID
jgi:hypothetical protein